VQEELEKNDTLSESLIKYWKRRRSTRRWC